MQEVKNKTFVFGPKANKLNIRITPVGAASDVYVDLGTTAIQDLGDEVGI